MDPNVFADMGIGLLILFALIGIGILIVILVILYAAASRIPPVHRKMEPGLVFLLLIPLFNLVWMFFVVLRISDGYKSYFDEQGRADVGDCGKGVGLAWAICNVLNLIPVVNFISAIAGLVCMIIYLVTISGLKKQIPQMGYGPPMR